MATSRILPAASNPYSQGATIFDSTPYTQFVLNKQAREEANRNAFIKGFQDIGNNINAAGLDNNDAQDLYAKKAAWQQYVMGHQKEYQNPSLDNGRTYAEANRLYNDAAQHIQAAKQKMANIAEGEKILHDPTKADMLNESFHQKLENAKKPISTMGKPNGYQPIDYTDIYNPKPFDEAKYRTELNPYVKYSQKEGKVTTDKDFNTKTDIYEVPEYDKLQLFKIAENKYAQTPSYQREMKRLSNNPETYRKYNQIFKDNFGADLNISHPEEMAVAHTLSLMPQERLKETKTGFDRVGYFKYTNAITDKQHKENIALNNSKKPIETVDFLKKGIDVVNTKDNPSINDYFSAWKSNQEKDSEGNNIGFLGMKVHPAGSVIEGAKMKKPSKSDVIELRYADKIPLGNGLSSSEIKTEYLDPSEITLSKLASLNKKFLGSDNKVEKGVQTESVNRANSVSSPKSSEPKKASGIVWKNK